MESKTYSTDTDTPEVQEIIMSGRIGAIAVDLGDRLGISPLRSLILFYASDTCRRLHTKVSGLYLFGNRYIADEFMIEQQNHQ